MRRFVTFTCALLLGSANLTAAQDGPPAPRAYEGVQPGSTNPPPAVPRIARRSQRRPSPAAIVTWPGFQMTGSGGSRFFIQTSAPVSVTTSASDGRYEIVFPNTAVHLSNSTRWLETQHFQTPVLRARLERRGNDMVFVLFLRAAATPRVTSGSESGYAFTYIDFEAGRFREGESPLASSVPR